MNKLNTKDKKIKIFKEIETEQGTIKEYIHPLNIYLRASVRPLSTYERNNAQAQGDNQEFEFIVNNRNITPDMLLEYKNDVYKISYIYSFEDYKIYDIKIRAYPINKRQYTSIRGLDNVNI